MAQVVKSEICNAGIGQQLLAQIGVTPTLLLPDADEDVETLEAVACGEAPAAYVQRLNKLLIELSA